MSSPENLSNSSRVGTRVVLREITASLHNLSPIQSPRRKSGNDSTVAKTTEHEVKVCFDGEFTDVGSVAYSVPESLSSASRDQSISTTLSTKSNSGICLDSMSVSLNETTNTSYVSANIPGVEDLILGCADIHLGSDDEQSFNAFQNSQDLSQDQTFASATDEPNTSISTDFPSKISLDDSDKVSQVIENRSTVEESTYSSSNRTQDIQERPILIVSNSNSNILKTEEPKESKGVSVSCIENSNDISNSIPTCDFPNGVEEVSLPEVNIEEPNLNNTVCLSPAKTSSDAANFEESVPLENTSIETVPSPVIVPITPTSSVPVVSDYAEDPSLPSISAISYLSADSCVKFEEGDVTDSAKNLLDRTSSPVNNPKEEINSSSQDELKSPLREIVNKDSNRAEIFSPSPCNIPNDGESCKCSLDDTPLPAQKIPEVKENLETSVHEPTENVNITVSKAEFSLLNEKENDLTLDSNKLNGTSDTTETEIVEKTDGTTLDVTTVVTDKKDESIEYENEEQSSEEKLDTTLTLQDTSLNSDTVADVEQYIEFKPQRQSTTLALPSIEQPNFEELKANTDHIANDICKSSLEFTEESDYFASATSEIFQDPTCFDFLITHGNSNTTDRLRTESLYVTFDPLVANTSVLPQENNQPINGEEKEEEPQKKIEQPEEESKQEDTPLISDVNMSKELELVKATVLQLEEELEKEKKKHKTELERQKNAFQEIVIKLEAQMAQEVKSKSQMAVVIDEYEKSISQLLTEKEKDRTNFKQEKAKLQEESHATNVYLTNTEAAFNGIHQKYERMKGVVSVYKNNEAVLKESIQENMETIKGLEQRYDQMKNHAMAQLQKANLELDVIRKQHEDETVKLHAKVKKAEVKSNSLAELLEQKTKEVAELTQILDELIARVGPQNAK